MQNFKKPMKKRRRMAMLLTLVMVFVLVVPSFQVAAEGLGESETTVTRDLGEAKEAATDGLDGIEGAIPILAPAPDPVRDEIYYTVNFYIWDDSIDAYKLEITDTVAAGSDATPPLEPLREGHVFTEWNADYTNVQSNLNIYAQYRLLETYTVKINYTYEDDAQAAQPYIATVKEGYPLNVTIESPVVEGFAPDQTSVSILIASVFQDVTYTVTYTGANNSYKVVYLLQDLNLQGYTLVESETKYGNTGELVTAYVKTYEGFTALACPGAEIAADGSTELEVRYTRNSYAVYFHTGSGSYVAPYTALYDAPLESPPASLTRPSYTFDRWEIAYHGGTLSVFPAVMPAGDLTVTALWMPEQVDYTIVYWLESITGTSYDYVGSVSTAGLAGEAPTMPDEVPPGTIIFPIAADHYTYNGIKTTDELSSLNIKGDGSTIVNMYYDRKTYAITFDDQGQSLTVDGVTYSHSGGNPYQITAKYGANIGDLWPTAPTYNDSAYAFRGWRNTAVTTSNMYHTTKQYFMLKELVNDGGTLLVAEFVQGTYEVTVHYLIQNIENDDYTENENYKQTINWIGTGTWYPKAFDGLTAEEPEGFSFDSSTGDIYFHYTRNSYSIEFYNGASIIATKSGLQYESDIENLTIGEPTRPVWLSDVYTFGGWYTTQGCYDNSKFLFEGAKMPSKNLILYAKWVKPEYTVTFVPANGASSWTETVYLEETVDAPVAPIWSGYVFDGWYMENAVLRYVFDFPITEDITLTARWLVDNPVDYTAVCYKLNADGSYTEFGRKIIPGGISGTTITATAPLVLEGYLPNKVSKSLILGADNNVVSFYYDPFDEVEYTVSYVDAITGDLMVGSKVTSTQKAFETENYKYIEGYWSDALQKTLQLSQDVSENVITFYYTGVPFTVKHYLEQLDNSYELNLSDIQTVAANTTATVTPKTYTGYVYNAGMSNASGIVVSNGTTVFSLYYDLGKYIVTYDGNGNTGGSAPTDGNPYYYYGNTVSVLDNSGNLLRTKYGFSGWNTAANGSGTSYAAGDQFQMPGENVTLYAKWTADGNSGGGSSTVDPKVTIEDTEVPLSSLDKENHFAYITGYPDGTVRPGNNITRAETASIFFRLLTQDSRAEIWSKTNGYPDIRTGDWYNNAISTLANGNILSGYPDGTFSPNGTITRAELATIAARFATAEDITNATGTAVFSDISGHWAESYIKLATNLGYVSGYEDGTFHPGEPITRAEVATLLNRVLNRSVESKEDMLVDMVTWPDNSADAWYYAEIQEATNSHYFQRKSNVKYEIWTGLRDVLNWSILNVPDAEPGDISY